MTIDQQVLEYLRENRAWLKKSPAVFLDKLNRMGIISNERNIREIQQKVRQEKVSQTNDATARKRLFYDIETSPNEVYSWRVGNKISISADNIIRERAIICISWKWEDDPRVFSLRWDNDQCDRAMLEEFVEVLHSSSEAIGHNADNFDIRWIRARCMYHGIAISPYIKTVDTLKMARKLYTNSHRLDYIAKFTGGDGKLSTDFGMWKRIMKNNSKEDLDRMVIYCEKDVIELERIHSILKRYSPTPVHRGISNEGTKCSCPECGSEDHSYMKKHITSRGTLSHELRCSNCDTFFMVSNTTYNNRKQ